MELTPILQKTSYNSISIDVHPNNLKFTYDFVVHFSLCLCRANGLWALLGFRWVAYSERCFSGEQCILEKGKHPATLHWGGNYGAAKSIRPIRLVSTVS